MTATEAPVPTPGRGEHSAAAVYLVGSLTVVALAAIAAWMIVRHTVPPWAAVLPPILAGLGTFLLGRELARTTRLTHELAERETRLNSIIGSAMDAIITVDGDQNIVLFNAAAEKVFDCPAREAVGSPLDRFIPERFRQAHRRHVQRFGEAGATVRRMGGDLVLAGLRADGKEFPIDASISHVTVNAKKFYTVILRDVTGRQRAAEALDRSHHELRELYESMHQVREAERTRIARELHDELAQSLTAIKMDAAWIATRLAPEHGELVRKAERMKSVVDGTVAAVRRIAADLRPVMLDDLGFMAALENLTGEVSERAGIEIALDAEGDLDFAEPLATALYRMVQEALTNVARHAQARSAVVELRHEGERLRVRVRDDGRGFQPDAARKSYGVLGIRERARTLGGAARIHSPPEGGTIVDIDIPLAAREAKAAS
jgi:PAS domain S-box-containing protein